VFIHIVVVGAEAVDRQQKLQRKNQIRHLLEEAEAPVVPLKIGIADLPVKLHVELGIVTHVVLVHHHIGNVNQRAEEIQRQHPQGEAEVATVREKTAVRNTIG